MQSAGPANFMCKPAICNASGTAGGDTDHQEAKRLAQRSLQAADAPAQRAREASLQSSSIPDHVRGDSRPWVQLRKPGQLCL